RTEAHGLSPVWPRHPRSVRPQVSTNDEHGLSPPEDDSAGKRHPPRAEPPRAGLLDVGDGHDGGRLREGFGLVRGADAVDVVAAALGEARGRLHAALGDEDPQVRAVELEVATQGTGVTRRRWQPARPAWPPGGPASWRPPGRAGRRAGGRSRGWTRARRCP